ncbi:MAG: oligosaccharide flippase family protein [bacterium]|nr:oligosaccharide flippase family protein [bacterium]
MAIVESSEHLDPTSELSLETVKHRAVKGVLFLTGRTFILQVIALVATFLLTIFLGPSEYGVFFLVSAVINFFAYFSDIGLAAALVQKREAVTEEDLRTTFTVQQVLVLGLLVIIFAVTPIFRQWYGLESSSIFLLWALAISLVFSSLKTIPSILLERRLDFNRLVIPQIAETILFNLIAVFLAWRGFGITSFTIAVLVRGLSGLVIIYCLMPWMPGLAFSKKSLRRLLRFGLPYQVNTFLAVVKDDGLTMVLGSILGPAGIGLLGWAQKWGFAPLRFFMDQVIKVTFPAFSRMQGNREELSNAVSRSIFFVCFLVFPSLVGLILIAPILVEIIPRYEKWQPALLALGLYGINAAWAAVTTPLTNVLNAVGKIGVTFKLMIMWTVLTWILVPSMAILAGVNGAAAGAAVVATTSVIAILVVRRHIVFDLAGSTGKPLLAAFLMGSVLLFLRNVLPATFSSVVLLITTGIVVYGIAIYLLSPTIISDGRKIIYAIRNK